MLNAEKYKDEILEAINSKNELSLKKPDGFSFDKYSNKIEPCSDDEYSNCENCLFDDEDLTHSCRYHRTKWLLSECKEPIKLTRLEYDILKYISDNTKYLYITRNSCNGLFLYGMEPSKDNGYWHGKLSYDWAQLKKENRELNKKYSELLDSSNRKNNEPVEKRMTLADWIKEKEEEKNAEE